ncbi:MAG: hypothetical protein LIO75_09495 [Lachnospiraceae bacterium]|nr:hypothetical protein [Lachnospiraceae bacterium]
MAELRDIHAFAVKWIDKFKNPEINYIELVDHYMADDCSSLGFEMDCGHAFGEKYGKAASNVAELKRIIDSVDDIMLLGSAIYSQWRYFNHWAYSGAEILEPDNRAWFITALDRLAALTDENATGFPVLSGKIQRIKICSNSICYGPRPLPEDEVEQHLTLTRDGRIFFASYVYGEGNGKYRKNSIRRFKIDQTKVERIMTLFEKHFSEYHDYRFVTDVGDWKMEITNTEGKRFVFCGSLCADIPESGTDLSELVRDELGMQNLLVIDGNNKPDTVMRIVLSYHRVTKIKPKVPFSETIEYVTWDYSEDLILDRNTETLEHTQQIGTECSVNRKYHVQDGVSSFLDDLDADADKLFANIAGNPEDAVYNPMNRKDYTITIDYKKGPQKIISGTFDKNGLPDDYESFIDDVWDFIEFYGAGEIFSSSIYSRPLRRKDELIFCSVIFEDGGKHIII